MPVLGAERQRGNSACGGETWRFYTSLKTEIENLKWRSASCGFGTWRLTWKVFRKQGDGSFNQKKKQNRKEKPLSIEYGQASLAQWLLCVAIISRAIKLNLWWFHHNTPRRRKKGQPHWPHKTMSVYLWPCTLLWICKCALWGHRSTWKRKFFFSAAFFFLRNFVFFPPERAAPIKKMFTAAPLCAHPAFRV